MASFLLTIIVLGAGLAWSSALQSKHAATEMCRRLCDEAGLQMLDHSVSINKLGLGKDPRGRIRLQRVYTFEFSVQGVSRYQGQLALTGRRLTAVYLDHPDGNLIWTEKDLQQPS